MRINEDSASCSDLTRSRALLVKKTLQHWIQTFLDAIDREENESLRHQSSRGKGRIDWRVIGVCVVGCVVLSLLEYYGSSSDYKRLRPLVELVGGGLMTSLQKYRRHRRRKAA